MYGQRREMKRSRFSEEQTVTALLQTEAGRTTLELTGNSWHPSGSGQAGSWSGYGSVRVPKRIAYPREPEWPDGGSAKGEGQVGGGDGRQIPMNRELLAVLSIHAGWFTERFRATVPEPRSPRTTMLAMLERYSHIPMVAKRQAVEALTTGQNWSGVPTKVPTIGESAPLQ